MILKALYKAENEFMANTIKDLLEQNGIPALIHSFQIPAYDGVAQMMRPAWGEVLVAEDDFERAQEVIVGFLAGEAKKDSPEGDGDV